MDGGYFDNSGVSANLEIYRALLPWINLYNRSFHYSQKNHGVPLILPIYIHIDNEYKRLTEDLKKRRPISQLFAPAQTIYLGKEYQTRNAINRARKTFVTYNGTGKIVRRFFHFNTFNLPGADAPLGWILSSSSMKELDSQKNLPQNKKSLEGVKEIYDRLELIAEDMRVDNIDFLLPE